MKSLHWQCLCLLTCNDSLCLNDLCSRGTAQANCVICTFFAGNLASIESCFGEEQDIFGVVVKIMYMFIFNTHTMSCIEPSHNATNSFVQTTLHGIQHQGRVHSICR